MLRAKAKDFSPGIGLFRRDVQDDARPSIRVSRQLWRGAPSGMAYSSGLLLTNRCVCLGLASTRFFPHGGFACWFSVSSPDH